MCRHIQFEFFFEFPNWIICAGCAVLYAKMFHVKVSAVNLMEMKREREGERAGEKQIVEYYENGYG